MGHSLVTGASSGIGRSLARRLAADGEAVTVVARRTELLAELVAEIEAAGGRAQAFACDVTDPDAVREAVQKAEGSFGPVTRLVANAGGSEPTDARAFRADHVARVVDLNLVGVARSIEAVLPGMLERGEGHLVATSSLAGRIGLPTSAAYAAAKAGLTNLMESLRIDLRGTGVDVTVIEPGFVRVKAKKKKKFRPFLMELEPATERMHRAIVARRARCAFPASLVALLWLAGWLPKPLLARVLGGRGPRRR